MLQKLPPKKPPNFLVFHDVRHDTGQAGEDFAASYLVAQGWIIVARNLRIGQDEIDLIAIDPESDDCVIVEVKSFSAADEFELTAGWNWRKSRAIQRAVRHLLQAPPVWLEQRSLRIDLITICASQVTHYPNISQN